MVILSYDIHLFERSVFIVRNIELFLMKIFDVNIPSRRDFWTKWGRFELILVDVNKCI